MLVLPSPTFAKALYQQNSLQHPQLRSCSELWTCVDKRSHDIMDTDCQHVRLLVAISSPKKENRHEEKCVGVGRAEGCLMDEWIRRIEAGKEQVAVVLERQEAQQWIRRVDFGPIRLLGPILADNMHDTIARLVGDYWKFIAIPCGVGIRQWVGTERSCSLTRRC